MYEPMTGIWRDNYLEEYKQRLQAEADADRLDRAVASLEADRAELLRALEAMVHVRNLAAVETATDLIKKHRSGK